MLRSGNKRVAKEKYYGGKKTINVWDIDANNIVITKLVEAKRNCKYLIG